MNMSVLHNGVSAPLRPGGAVLAITMVLLVVVALLAAYAAANVNSDLRMVRNLQESVRSLNSAEAGTSALIKAIFDTPALLNGTSNADPLAGVNPNPLVNVTNRGDDAIDLNVVNTVREGSCPRNESGTSARIIVCDHYRIESEHTSDFARTKVDEGVFAEVIGRTAP